MNTLNMPTHEHLRLLRNDEKVLCKKVQNRNYASCGQSRKNQYFLL